MAVPATTTYETEGSLGEVESIAMTIDENGMQFLMSILTNLYENPTLAVVREYSTNAVDAHIDAGYDGPVEVTLPNAFQKNFIVRDYGPGMDIDDIRNTYSKYVASTKRQDNTQAGMFGIGAKSALALGDTFIVESIKDGHKIVVSVQREARGKASMKVIVNNVPTDEPSGTTIKVPAKNTYDFEHAAKRFYKYVKKGVFEVNGEDWGESFKGIKLDDDLYALPSDSYYETPSVIVMGNVPYTVNVGNPRGVVKYVEPGTFEPTPPREGLEQTDGFKDKIELYILDAINKIAGAATETIKDMTPTEAAKWLKKHRRNLTNWGAFGKVKYDGRTMGSMYDVKDAVVVQGSSTYAPFGTVQVSFANFMLGIHITEWTGKTIKDMNKYVCQKAWGMRARVGGYPDGVFVYLNSKTPTHYHPDHKFTWTEAQKVRTSSTYSNRGGSNVHKAGDDWKVPTKRAYYNYNGTPTFSKSETKVVPYDEWKGANDPRTLVYFSPTELDSRDAITFINALFENDDIFLVIKYANQFDKTKRENPEAVHFEDYGESYAKSLIDKHGEAGFAQTTGKGHKMYRKLQGDLFDEWRRIEGLAETQPTGVSSEDVQVVRGYGKKFLTIEPRLDTVDEEIQKTYPLISQLDWRPSVEAVQHYVTMTDNYNKENEA